MDVAKRTKGVVATTTVGLPVSSNRIASSILPEVQEPQRATPATRKSASAAISSSISLVAALEAAGLVRIITLLTPKSFSRVSANPKKKNLEVSLPLSSSQATVPLISFNLLDNWRSTAWTWPVGSR